MSQPKTLLEMAGADMTPNALSDSTLVLIDCQMEYVTGAVPLPGVDDALAEAGKVLARACVAAAPVVHIVHQGQAVGAFDLDGEGGQIAPQVAQSGDETIIRKGLPNAFAGTTLHAALELGYRSTLNSGAAATRDLPTPSGGVIDAASLHDASLAAIADRFAIIVKSADQLPD